MVVRDRIGTARTQYHFDTLAEVQGYATRWMWSYNHERPNMALGGITTKQRLAMAASFSSKSPEKWEITRRL
jgi:putative transposase